MSVVVLGSANVDVVIDLERIPNVGETVITNGSRRGRGGKGNNQAVAAARAGAPTRFIGAVGADDSGDYLLAGMHQAGIDTSLVRRVGQSTSGTAYVMVDRDGQNAIVVVAGANAHLTGLGADEQRAIRAAEVLLMQLEIPPATVLAAAKLARAGGTYVMLNAAPYAPLTDELIESIDLLIVNEHEAALMAGMSGSPGQLAQRITERIPDVLITLGAAGALLLRRGLEPLRVLAPQVRAIDTTGAGDTFCGAYAAALISDVSPQEALELAASAAALAVQTPGAVAAIPTQEQIRQAHREFYQ